MREPENVYLGPEDGDFFWEIVGFRLSGHPFPVVGAARFRRHDYPGVGDARESLAAFLSSPPRPPRSDESASPPGTISLLLPRATETIPAFLRGLRAGRSVARVHLDPELIEVAFDFRMHNPSALDSLRAKAGPLCQHLFRSARGHVIAGRCHGVVHGTERDRRFIALTEVEQRTPRGRFRLPALVLNRSFVALSADVSEEEARFASANWVPFLSTSASAKHLLLG